MSKLKVLVLIIVSFFFFCSFTYSAEVPEFTKVITGFGNNRNYSITAMENFKGDTYFGTYAGCEVWTTHDNVLFDPAVTQGFDTHQYTKIWDLEKFKGRLYAATEKSDYIWETDNGLNWNPIDISVFNSFAKYEAVSFLKKAKGYLYAAISRFGVGKGAYLWKTKDLEEWIPITQDGFGNNNNHIFVSFLAIDDYIYISTQESKHITKN